LVRGDKLKGEPVNNKRAMENKKIEIFTGVEVKEFVGGGKLQKLKLSRKIKPKGAKNESDELEVDAAFVLIGHVPNSELAKELGMKLNARGEIIIDRLSRTNLEGVFGAGDCCDTEFKQAIVGVSEGVAAAYSANEYLKKKK